MRSYLQCTAQHLADFVEKRRHPRQVGILNVAPARRRGTSRGRAYSTLLRHASGRLAGGPRNARFMALRP